MKKDRQLELKKSNIIILIISVASTSIWDLLYFNFNVFSGGKLIILWLISVAFFIFSCYKLLVNYKLGNNYFKVIFYIFFLYTLFIIFRAFPFSLGDVIKTYMISDSQFWPLIIPLFVFFDKRITTVALFIKYIYILIYPFLVLNLIYHKLILEQLSAELVIHTLVYPLGFFLLNARYVSNKKVNISFAIIFISFVSLAYLARRNAVVTLTGFMMSAYVLNTMNRSKVMLFRIFPFLIGIGIFCFFTFTTVSEKITKKLDERISEDTRSGLFQQFFFDLTHTHSMALGKGMNGTYYCPIEGQVTDDGVVISDETNRSIIENGYLQLMLKGGIIYIVLFLLVLIPAAFYGIFKSSNQFSKACGVMILLWLIDMSIYGLPTFCLHYIIIWICVGVCYQKNIRDKTNEEIQEEFQKINLV